MFCKHCGTQIDDDLTFCTNCGVKLEDIAAVNVVSQVQPVQSDNQQYQQYSQPSTYVNTKKRSASPKKVLYGEAVKLFFVNFFNFKGRSTRSEYWYAYLFNFFVNFIVVCLLCCIRIKMTSIYRLFDIDGIPIIILILIIRLFLAIPNFTVSIRRLHDTGKSWAYMFVQLIPCVGSLLLFIQYCQKSDADNKWGPAPEN